MASIKALAICYVAFICGLIILCAVSYYQYVSAKEGASYSGETVRECQTLASQIKRLREQTAIASTQRTSKTVASSELIGATTKTGISEPKILSIHHLPPEKLDGSPFIKENVVLAMSQVEIARLVRLMLDLQQTNNPLEATALTLRPPSRAIDPKDKLEVWDAEITFTKLVLDLR